MACAKVKCNWFPEKPINKSVMSAETFCGICESYCLLTYGSNMMAGVSFKHCGPALSEETIEAMEFQLDCRLPEDYREFLLKYNGGTPNPNGFDVPDEEYPEAWVDDFHFVDENLCTPCEEAKGGSFAFQQFEYGNDVPDGYLIIGTSCRDNKLLLRLHGKQRGEVHLKLIADFPEEETKESGIYPVAKSFSAFLNKLRD